MKHALFKRGRRGRGVGVITSLPYVRAWAEKYKGRGLVVVGVHSPECAFEKNVGYVRRAAKGLRVDYPVAVARDHAVWRAFKNRYGPVLYFTGCTLTKAHKGIREPIIRLVI